MEKEKSTAGIVHLCAEFSFINHDNKVLKDFYVFSWTKHVIFFQKKKVKACDIIVHLSACT